MKAKITLLPGDGIGPEVVEAASELLKTVGEVFGHKFEMDSYLIGGCAIDEYKSPLPEKTLKACEDADAILLGAVGGLKWDDPSAKVRPEQGLLGLRKNLDLYANLRPVLPHPDLVSASPLKKEYLEGVDMLVVRELTGGIYFGQPRHRQSVNGETQAVDTMVYKTSEIERAARLAFSLAHERKNKVSSIDKSNVLETSRLWRETVSSVSKEYPSVILEHLLVDAAAMHLLTRPSDFDVIVTSNLFGDILTDEASVLTGSMGNMPSASLGSKKNSFGLPLGLYEPIHGSAPDIAGKGVANPIGTILSSALLLRHSLGLEEEAKALENAVDVTLNTGIRTADIATQEKEPVSTEKMTAKIIENFDQLEIISG
ncbi:MAG: 3-isopropylmalate dehydrogenase [Chloroflexi bacterium]|nr:3-isopropylmalate dehydrogenase [Chloroflexota bacterium]